ncbi:class II aldolase/adducin family protein [Spirillospora sp. NPDC048911]|uniref:class II aldolase/adducin family protein n=1 Tax=Spirillospora sp. NPDC048911 TaxID=3364527 RepID=UPI00371C1471
MLPASPRRLIRSAAPTTIRCRDVPALCATLIPPGYDVRYTLSWPAIITSVIDGRSARPYSRRPGAGRLQFARGLTHGRTGNLSVRVDEGFLCTPTGRSLGSLTSDRLSLVGLDGPRLSGPRPSKEASLHAAVYRARPGAGAVIHLHGTHSVAVSCHAEVDAHDALPPLTAYYAMRVGRLPVLPYHAPGDPALEPLAERTAATSHAFLLANHGPVVAGADLAGAADIIEELEETARLWLLLRGHLDEVFYPGEIEDRNARSAEHTGVALPARTRRDLGRLARECGIDDAAETLGLSEADS